MTRRTEFWTIVAAVVGMVLAGTFWLGSRLRTPVMALTLPVSPAPGLPGMTAIRFDPPGRRSVLLREVRLEWYEGGAWIPAPTTGQLVWKGASLPLREVEPVLLPAGESAVVRIPTPS